ncbi:MAG: porin family protein [Phycisphaerales bacterium]|jgi:hypothetical protein
MKRGLVVLSLVGLMCAGVATASVQQGDTELDFLGGFLAQNGDNGAPDVDAWFLSGALGYFFTDNIQGQVAAMGVWTSMDTGDSGSDADVDVYGIGVRGKYHFMPTNQWVPYVGAQLMWATANIDAGGIDEDVDGTLWGPLAGLRYELNANNDFYVEYQYHLWEGDVGDFLNDGHALLVGIIHQFK